MKTGFTIVLISLLVCTNAITQPNSSIKWQFDASGKILSSPITDGDIIYFGSNDSVFYALNLNSGELKWKYSTEHAIRTKPLIRNDYIYFSSGHDVYCLKKKTGNLIWKYSEIQAPTSIQLDFWDYKDGSPIADKSNIYIGFSNGKLIGFDLLTGEAIMEFTTDQMAAIKCGLALEKNTLFFGDWLGKVYALSVPEGKIKWAKKMYDKQPYSTFGQLNTQFLLHENGLYFGGRNPEFKVLDKNTGEVIWAYKEENGGWISGDPFIQDQSLYVGGSDNHELFSFDLLNGMLKWKYLFLNNNFTNPVSYQNYLLFTTGDAYSVFDPTNSGTGYLYALNIEDGSIHNFIKLGGNLNSNIIIKNKLLFAGSEDGFMYAVNLDYFLKNTSDLKEKGYLAFKVKQIPEGPISEELIIEYFVAYNSNIQINLKNIENEIIMNLFEGVKDKGSQSFEWDFQIENGSELNDGYYFIEITSKEFSQKFSFQKKKQS